MLDRRTGEKIWSVSLICRYCNNGGQQETRHRKHGHGDQVFPYRAWRLKLKRLNYECQHCGSVGDVTIDHIKPITDGGLLVIRNLQPLCRKCNSKKGGVRMLTMPQVAHWQGWEMASKR
jgi:5-methylcytosine-specific restriction endonuclease McrA